MYLKSNIFLVLIFIFHIVTSSLIKIPFKIIKPKSGSKFEKYIEDISFHYKLYSLIEIGTPPQNIETFFNLKISNYFISNTCNDCLSFYSYKNSNSFIKLETDEKPFLYGSTFYGNETFYFYDENNKQKIIENMLIFVPELKGDKEIKNCLNIGLKFPDFSNNNFQESFIQQLKHKNTINQYFWTIIFYDDDKINNDYVGEFIFGDIFNDYFRKNDKELFSYNKITHTYTGLIKKKNSVKEEIILEWGLQFDEIYFIDNLNQNNKINTIYIHDLSIEFDININIILGTSTYYNNIIVHFFNYYFNKNICKEAYMNNKLYKFIYCNAVNFTKNDLDKFPTLNFKNNILRYIFTLDSKDLFSLTNDKQYYIFNIMLLNILNGNNDEQKWVFGLTFLKKYHFIFDSDNKLIYFYNKNGKFSDEFENIDDNNEISDENKKDKIINNMEKNNYFNIVIIIIIFIILAILLIVLIKKILFKKGYILMRIKKANELMDEYDYSNYNNNINDIKGENKLINQQCEMQIK